MRTLMFCAVLGSLLWSRGNVLAWDSACEGCDDGDGATMPWSHDEFDEHRQIYDRAMRLAGVSDAHRLVSLAIPSELTAASYIPDFASAAGLLDVAKAADQFAQLPDYGYSMHDWLTQFQNCPPNATSGSIACHKFADHMGVLNSNHFLPQASLWYEHYHQIALNRAQSCAAQRDLTGARASEFAEFNNECVFEALAFEGIAQHFLQDAWSTGHMWERWGGSILDSFAGTSTSEKLWHGLTIALVAGVIHGTEPKTGFGDPLSAPDPRVRFATGNALYEGAGDRHVSDLFQGAFPAQSNLLMGCAISSVAEVYDIAGLETTASTSRGECFGQRVTNAAIEAGSELLSVATPGLLVLVVDILRDDMLDEAALRDLNIRLRRDIDRMGRTIAEQVARNPVGTELANGGLGSLLGTEPNGAYVSLPGYEDPPSPWSATSGDPRESSIPRAFHRAHADEWCDIGSEDYLEGLRGAARSYSTADGSQLALCVELVRRHIALVEPKKKEEEGMPGAGTMPPDMPGTPAPARCAVGPTNDSPPGETNMPPEEMPEQELPEPKESLCQLLASGGHVIEIPVDKYDPPISDVRQLAELWCLPEEERKDPEQTGGAESGAYGDLPGGADCDPDGGSGGGGGGAGNGDGGGPDGASGTGDPHHLTTDGLAYDFQAQGEFVLLRSLDDDFEIQVRTQSSNGSDACANVSYNVAAALRVVGRRVTFTAGKEIGLRVNGTSVVLAEGASLIFGGARVRRVVPTTVGVSATYRVEWPDGSVFWVNGTTNFLGTAHILNVWAKPASARASRLEGLWGNFDGSPWNDLLLADHSSAVQKDSRGRALIDERVLYDQVADVFRVLAASALFDYPTGRTTDDYQRPGTPAVHPSTALWPAADVAAARSRCQTGGVSEPHWADACALDTLCSASPERDAELLAATFAKLQVPVLTLEIQPQRTGGGGGTVSDTEAPTSVRDPSDAGTCEAFCLKDTDCYVHGVKDQFTCDTVRHRCRRGVIARGCGEDDNLFCKVEETATIRCTADAECPVGNVCIAKIQNMSGPSGWCVMRADLRQCSETTQGETITGQLVQVCGKPGAYCERSYLGGNLAYTNCLDCKVDQDCGPNRFCGSGTCRSCSKTVPCAAPTPVCSSEGTCVQCSNDTHCGGRPCQSDGTCGCNSDADCPDVDGKRRCDIETQRCGCGSDNECDSYGRGFDSGQGVCL